MSVVVAGRIETDFNRRPVSFVSREHSPGNARQLIRQRHNGDIVVGAGGELFQPGT